MKKIIRPGQLVEALSDQVASYSDYGGRPPMSFRKGMLGVVRDRDPGGVQVEFFSPETGLMESSHCKPEALKNLPWPGELADLSEKYSLGAKRSAGASADWYFCGSLGPLGAITYLKAVAKLNHSYFNELCVETLRIPFYHYSRLRTTQPIPERYPKKVPNTGDEVTLDLTELCRQPVDPAPAMAM